MRSMPTKSNVCLTAAILRQTALWFGCRVDASKYILKNIAHT